MRASAAHSQAFQIDTDPAIGGTVLVRAPIKSIQPNGDWQLCF